MSQQVYWWGLVGEFLKTLEALPVIGPVIDFLTQLVGELLPFAMLVAVAALILLIGNYGGVAVRNVAKGDGDGIPHALATSTAARNVSMALILASQYFVKDRLMPDGRDEGIVVDCGRAGLLNPIGFGRRRGPGWCSGARRRRRRFPPRITRHSRLGKRDRDRRRQVGRRSGGIHKMDGKARLCP